MVNIKQSALEYKNSFETNFENYLKRNDGCDLVLNDYIKFEKENWEEIKNIIDTDEIDFSGLPEGYQPDRYSVLNEIWEAYGKEGNHLVMNKVKAILSFLDSKIKKDALNIVPISNINNTFDKIPKIFKSNVSYSFFIALKDTLHDKFICSKYSFIFHYLLKDGYLEKKTQQQEFILFLKKENFISEEENWSQLKFNRETKRVNQYNDLKHQYPLNKKQDDS